MEISGVQREAMDGVVSCPRSQSQQQPEKKPRPQPEQALKCPRCDSTNTKFCYYNNYSLSQPRYFCKGCRRYWTKGGSLRNVPVGGGCRKNGKRSSSSSNSSPSSPSTKKSQDRDLAAPDSFLPPLPLPPLSFDPNDLTLAFAGLRNQPAIVENNDRFMLSNPNPNNPSPTPFLDILRGGYVDGADPGGSFQSLYYGFGGNHGHVSVDEVEGEVSGDHGHMMFSLDGGLFNGAIDTSTEAVRTATCANEAGTGDHGGEDHKVVMGLHQWQQLGGGNSNNNNIPAELGVDSTRDYWNGVGNSSWHGIINSSLM